MEVEEENGEPAVNIRGSIQRPGLLYQACLAPLNRDERDAT